MSTSEAPSSYSYPLPIFLRFVFTIPLPFFKVWMCMCVCVYVCVLLHAFKFHLNIIVCVFICSLLFSFNIVRSVNVTCIAVVHLFSCPFVWLCLKLSILLSVVIWVVPLFLQFQIVWFWTTSVCVSPSHARVQASLLGSGSYPLAAHQSQLEGWLNHRLLDSTPAVFLSAWTGAWEFAFLTSLQAILLLRVFGPQWETLL